jgi:hypothetical protein
MRLHTCEHTTPQLGENPMQQFARMQEDRDAVEVEMGVIQGNVFAGISDTKRHLMKAGLNLFPDRVSISNIPGGGRAAGLGSPYYSGN